MASSSTQPCAASPKSILTPVMTLEGHKQDTPLLQDGKLVGRTNNNHISSICYFPGGKQLISGSNDETARRWDLQARKEIVKARDVCEQEVCAVGVSRDGRWVVTAGGTFGSHRGELRVSEVETGIVKTFDEDHLGMISCIDISVDSTLLASASSDGTICIRSLGTGNLVAVRFTPSQDFKNYSVGAIRFSQDSKKLAIKSGTAQCLEVWDVQAATYVRVGPQRSLVGIVTNAPMFWTTKDTIVAGFNFHVSHRTSDSRDLKTIYEFDASTLQKVGVPFKGHTDLVIGLALSFDCALLASAAHDFTIKLWAFESRQLLASFDVQHPRCIIFSPDSRQLVYTAVTKIHICDVQCDILSSSLPVQQEESSTSAAKTPRLADLLNSDATPRAVHRKPVISPVRPFPPQPLRQSPTIHSQRHTFFRYLRKLLPYSSHMNAAPLRNADLRDPLDFPATLPLPPNCFPSAQAKTQARLHTNSRENSRQPTAHSSTTTSTTFRARIHRLWATRALPPIVDVPLAPGKLRNAAAGAPASDDDLIRDEDYIPPSPRPDSQLRSKGESNTGQHGSGRLCFCF